MSCSNGSHALQVGREGRAAVLDVREALPANWSANGTLGLGRGLARGWLGSPWVADLQQRGVAVVRQQVLDGPGLLHQGITDVYWPYIYNYHSVSSAKLPSSASR